METKQDQGKDADVIIYRALIALSKERYLGISKDNLNVRDQTESFTKQKRTGKGNRHAQGKGWSKIKWQKKERKIEKNLPKGIQRQLGAIQFRYAHACRAQQFPSNVFNVGIYHLFVDQENNYIVPFDLNQPFAYETRGGKIMASDRDLLARYNYSNNPVSVPRMREIMRYLAGKKKEEQIEHTELVMFLAAMVAEPSRYSVAHITNLITLGDKNLTGKESAFHKLSMTQGGSDPSLGRTPAYDERLKGMRLPERDAPKKVTDRDLAAVKRRDPSISDVITEELVKKYGSNEQLMVDDVKKRLRKLMWS